MFENDRKSLIQHWERSELCLQFEWQKGLLKRPKMVYLASFWKLVASCQTVLADRPILIEQKLVENTKTQ